MAEQRTQLATPSYKLKKNKKSDKKDTGVDGSTLIDLEQVSVLGAVNVKFPEQAAVKENQKSKKSTPSKSSTRDKELKALDQKWSKRFHDWRSFLCEDLKNLQNS